MHFRHRQEAFKTFTRIPIFLSLCYRLKFLYPKYFAPSSQSHSRISLKIFSFQKKYIYPGAQNFRLSKYFSFQNILHQVPRAMAESLSKYFSFQNNILPEGENSQSPVSFHANSKQNSLQTPIYHLFF